MTESEFDSNDWVPESGASTGGHRENDPTLPGYAPERDRVFRSHYQHANRLADRAYEQVRPAYELGFSAARDAANNDRAFEEIETDLENGWLNVRTAGGDWQAVRVFARAGFDAARQGSVEPYPETD
jgi:hypothetical protein